MAYTVEVEPNFDSMIAAAVARFQSEEAHAEVVRELEHDYKVASQLWKHSETQQLPSPSHTQ